MKNLLKNIAVCAVAFLSMQVSAQTAGGCCGGKSAMRWSADKANEWYAKQPWLSGCDYIPATAINQIEMWSKSTFDEKQIDKELSWAQELGFKTMRVFLSSVVYANDAKGFKKRIDKFLTICSSHGIRPMFVFFDDCWNKESEYGKQPEPKPGVHNSGWVQDPAVSMRADTAKMFETLEKYVTDIVSTFANDDRILLWDLYNEPGNNEHFNTSLPLLKKVFQWARSAKPSQPITVGVWNVYEKYRELSAYSLEHSDVISYHNYKKPEDHEKEVEYLMMLNRPLICTEYMSRRSGSTFQTVMPMLKKYNVAAINWGFVSGKTNTIFAWDTPLPDVKEPPLWFHDIYRQDKTPFDQEEVDLIKKMNGVE